MKSILPEFCLVGLLLSLHFAAFASGWFGLLPGLLLPICCFLVWPAAGVFLLARALKVFQKSRCVGTVNYILAFLCFAVTFSNLTNKSPYHTAYYGAIKIKLKLAYGSTERMHEMQSWAIAELKSATNSDTTPLIVLHRSEYPKWATDGRFPEPSSISIDCWDNDPNERYVQIFWGNRLGGWLLIVGNPALANRGEKWADGVYFSIYREGA